VIPCLVHPSEGLNMQPLAVENIEELRRQHGIDDAELREAISGLQVGDSVNLTFRSESLATSRETLPVRITSIRGQSLQGTLARKPATKGLEWLFVGAPFEFTTAQIHSVVPRLERVKRRSGKPLARK